jgi:hypothetical protein
MSRDASISLLGEEYEMETVEARDRPECDRRLDERSEFTEQKSPEESAR